MTLREKTVAAMLKTAEKYENPEGEVFFTVGSCSLCELFYYILCRGCPLASKRLKSEPFGCSEFASFQNAKDKYFMNFHDDLDGEKCKYKTPPPEFLERARVLRKHAEIVETWPEERFTPEGWIYSGKELSRDD